MKKSHIFDIFGEMAYFDRWIEEEKEFIIEQLEGQYLERVSKQ